ncbi:lipoprotein [Pedobacter punctiformis]|uniref:Type IV secretion system putative lipoprotein virB7 n=1 Tax=Pedobacter punctiformis TaxID=3004097 RepID=A0ABT4L8V2_9SPHI|nr:lipoprotein [Pedobacter sp. HCMS5-2]MCZ4244341.1 lipoprotein [Pedobacter sp. HCMS5-2]
MKKMIALALFVAVLSGCSSMNNNTTGRSVTVSGTIEKLGMTTFQYGTHLLKAENKTYALKSDVIKLDDFVNKPVTIKGKKVAGYPLEGGPDLIEVTLVKF